MPKPLSHSRKSSSEQSSNGRFCRNTSWSAGAGAPVASCSSSKCSIRGGRSSRSFSVASFAPTAAPPDTPAASFASGPARAPRPAGTAVARSSSHRMVQGPLSPGTCRPLRDCAALRAAAASTKLARKRPAPAAQTSDVLPYWPQSSRASCRPQSAGSAETSMVCEACAGLIPKPPAVAALLPVIRPATSETEKRSLSVAGR
mmetsp:Transcript_59990/g.178559  ORF Transcript_59990/g.178559 Transcript_59990/m.178559 type:complete len:202 (-) Transcript_59990:285-890(-)